MSKRRQPYPQAYSRSKVYRRKGYQRTSRRARLPTRRRRYPQGMRNARTGGFLGIELKFYDTSLTDAQLTSPTDATGGEHNESATIGPTTITQGTGESQRDGRKISMRSLFVSGLISVAAQAATSTADAGSTVFIAVVLDTQTNGATINSEDVYKNTAANALLAANPQRNLQFSSRFRVLAKKTMQISNMSMTNDTGATGGVIQAGTQRQFQFFVNLRGMNVLYKGTTETVANIVDNSLHIIAYTSGTALAPTISYNSRLRFIG